MRQFQIRPKRSPDGALEVSIAFDRSVAQLAPDEQARVFERAMGIALESAKTATDPIIARERERRIRVPA